MGPDRAIKFPSHDENVAVKSLEAQIEQPIESERDQEQPREANERPPVLGQEEEKKAPQLEEPRDEAAVRAEGI